MSLLDILRSGMKIADGVTRPLQATVTFYRFTPTHDGYEPETAVSGVPMRAIVDQTQRQVRTSTGQLAISRASILFRDRAAVSAATSGLGIKPEDRVVLPDGTTGPTLAVGGFVDAGTGQPIYTDMTIG